MRKKSGERFFESAEVETIVKIGRYAENSKTKVLLGNGNWINADSLIHDKNQIEDKADVISYLESELLVAQSKVDQIKNAIETVESL